MAPIRTNRPLINKQQHFLEKIENQAKSWSLFVAGSAFCITLTLILLIILEKTAVPISFIVLVAVTIVLCMSWLTWTIMFIFKSVKNQLIMYDLLDEISVDIEILGEELNKENNKDIDKT